MNDSATSAFGRAPSASWGRRESSSNLFSRLPSSSSLSRVFSRTSSSARQGRARWGSALLAMDQQANSGADVLEIVNHPVASYGQVSEIYACIPVSRIYCAAHANTRFSNQECFVWQGFWTGVIKCSADLDHTEVFLVRKSEWRKILNMLSTTDVNEVLAFLLEHPSFQVSL